MAVAAAAILGLGATSVKSAEAASVNFTFFEEANTPAVGVGSFSYDESTPYEGIFGSSFLGTPLEIKASDKLFEVKNLVINYSGCRGTRPRLHLATGVISFHLCCGHRLTKIH